MLFPVSVAVESPVLPANETAATPMLLPLMSLFVTLAVPWSMKTPSKRLPARVLLVTVTAPGREGARGEVVDAHVVVVDVVAAVDQRARPGLEQQHPAVLHVGDGVGPHETWSHWLPVIVLPLTVATAPG